MTTREAALRAAVGEIGVTEHPAGTNSGPRVNQYLASAGIGPGYPWCMAFVNWCYRQAGTDIEHPHEASVGFFEDWARTNGYLVEKPARGDIVCYRFDADNWPDHVGIIEEAGPTRLVTIEGNTAIGDDANGGKVMRRTRSYTRTRFARIPGALMEEDDMPDWFPAWWKWRLMDGRDATRPATAPAAIPQKYLDLVKVAEDFRAAKPDPSWPELTSLKAKIAAAKQALA